MTISSADPTTESSSDGESSMQAWLQAHLHNYVELNMLDYVPTLDESSSWKNGIALLCLAHRFCPSAIPDLPGVVQSENVEKASVAIRIFHDKFGVSATEDELDKKDRCSAYISAIRAAVDETESPTTETMRLIQATLVSETQSIHVTRRTRESTAEDDEFEQRATTVLKKVHRLRDQLNEMTLLTTSASSHQLNNDEALDADKDGNEGDLPSRVEKFESELTELREKDNADLQAYIQNLPNISRITLSARIQTVHAAVAALDSQLDDDFQAIRAAVLFSQLVTPIRNELEYIQAKMLKTATTEEGIHDLEERTQLTERMISTMENEHEDMLGEGKMYRSHFDALKQKHALVSSWVNEVRVWFAEAERNRIWIEDQIKEIKARPICDPLQSVDLSGYSLDVAAQLTTAHENTKKQVEKLNKEDLARLRAHVVALTSVQKDVNKDLSPADTTAIEIIFAALTSLDRLSHLMRRRSYDLQMLTLRLLWEQECIKAEDWVVQADAETIDLLQKARWTFEEEKIMDRGESDALKNLVIHMLLDLEQRVSEFDQGLFTTVVNMYQEMDRTSKVELAAHLEARQVDLEENFEALTKRIGYVRQVVEQRITVMDFVYRADELVAIGERIKEEMTIAEQQAVADDSDQEFIDRIRRFQEQAVQLVTAVAVRIRYPELHSPKADAEQNNATNAMIRTLISQRKSAVILSGDMLDHRLLTYQNVLEILSKAEKLYKELRQLEGSIEDQLGSAKEIIEDVLAVKCIFNQDNLPQLWKEYNVSLLLSKSIRTDDLKRIQDGIDVARKEGERHSVVTAQVDRLDSIMGRIRKLLDELDPKLECNRAELEALELRLDWENYLDDNQRLISDTTRDVWAFIEKAQWRPVTKTSVHQEYSGIELDALQRVTVNIKDEKLLDSLTKYYSTMISRFSDISGHIPIPEHFERRQESIQRAYHDLEDSVGFARAVQNQRVAMVSFLGRAAAMRETGAQLLEQIESATRSVMTDSPQSFSEDIEDFRTHIQAVWDNSGKNIPYPDRPCNVTPYGASSNHGNVNDEVKSTASGEQEKLLQMYDRIVNSNESYINAIKVKEMMQTYTKEAIDSEEIISDLVKAIISDQQNLAADVISPRSSPSPSELKMNDVKHKDRVKLVGLAMEDLQSRGTTLIASIEDADFRSYVPIAGMSTALAKLAGRGNELLHIAERHSQELDVYELRIHWELEIGDAISKAYELQDQLRILDEQKNALHRSARIDEQVLTAWKDSVIGAQHLFSQTLERLRYGAEESYEKMLAGYKTFGSNTPPSVDDRQHDMLALISKLLENASRMNNELDLLSSRSQWERAADDFLSSCSALEKRIDSFIQDVARWSPENQESIHSDDVLEELRTEIASYARDARDVIDCINDLLENQNLTFSEALARRKNDVRSALPKIENLFLYAQEVVEQRQKFSSILEDAVHIENLSDSLIQHIRDGVDVVDSLAQLDKEIEAFSNGASKIPYPVRDRSLLDASSQSLDNTANSIIRETLHVRQSKIEKLPELLADAVKSRQLRDQKNAAAEAYMSEAHSLFDWIQGKIKMVDDALSKPSSCSVREIQSAVGRIDAVSSSLKANENTFNMLTVQSMKLGDSSDVQQCQVELQSAWDQLTNKLGPKTRIDMIVRLQHAEFREYAELLTEKYQNLETLFNISKVSDLTDEKLAEWRQETDALETQLHESIGPNASDDHEKEIYAHLVGEHSKLVSSVEGLTKKLDTYRLLESFKDRAGALAAFFTQKTLQLEELRSGLGTITGASEDESRCRIFSDECGAIHRSIQDRVESYHDLKSFSRALKIQNVDISGISKEHDYLDQAYRNFEGSLEAARSVSALATQWKELHSTLGLVEKDIEKVDGMLKASDYGKADPQLAAVEARLSTVLAMANKLGESQNQGTNKASFQQRYGRVLEAVLTTKTALKTAKEETKKQLDRLAFVETASRIKAGADEESLRIKDRISKVDCICQQAGKDLSSLEQLYRSRVTKATASAFEVLGGLRDQLTELENVQMDEVALESARRSVTALENLVESEKKLNDFMRRSVGHARSADRISSWINDCRSTIRTVSASVGLSDDKDVEDDVEEIKLKVAKFEDFVQSFNDLTEKLMNDESILDRPIKDSASLIASTVIQHQADEIQLQWRSIQNDLSELLAMMARVSRGMEIVRQMKKILSICGESRERVGRLESDSKMLAPSPFNGYSLSGMLREQDVLTVEQELNAIEAKMNEQIALDIDKLNEMIRDYDDTDGNFTQQSAEMDAAVLNLATTIESKRKELARTLDIGRCLVITDDIDVLVGALEDAAKKATEKDDGSSNKVDLRSRSIELDARYKYYERKIVQSLDAAQLTADDITNEDDQEMILRHVRELREHWEVVDREVQAQKAELNKVLATMTPDRARKSSLPTRKASHFLRDRAQSPSRLTVKPPVRSNISSPLLSAASRLTPSTSIPRFRPTGSISATNSRLTPPTIRRIPSKSVSNSKLPKLQPPPPNTYVADPHNDLDMQIGRIVNETPYKVKVKMVPGEVGRYWFGDMNPKLAYCRVLKSKMVMVRVGGGWMELSQFLRSHTLFEGDFIPRTTESQAPDSRIQEGFIETRKQRVRRERSISTQGPAPPLASKSTPQNPDAKRGFVDGDRYIAVDKFGNQLEVRMTKASDKTSESTSTSTRRKDRS